MSDKLPPIVLVVESDEALSAFVSNNIERHWFNVEKAHNEEMAIKMASTAKHHVVVISSRTKGASAIEIAKKIRSIPKLSKMPIIFLLDQSELQSDYDLPENNLVEFVHRPFSPHQLTTAIKSLLRKSQPIFQDKVIKYRDLSMDLATYKVVRDGKVIHLGPTEFKILQLFIQAPKTVFSRQHIIDYIWGTGKDIEYRTVDVHVNRLRTLIKLPKDKMSLIKTIRLGGYCLNVADEID